MATLAPPPDEVASASDARSVLRDSPNLVIKIGGENAVRLGENFLNAQRRIARGQCVALVVSALRGPRNGGFNTTSKLISIADALEEHEVADALGQIDEVRNWTQSAFEEDIAQDDSLEASDRGRICDALRETLREEMHTLVMHAHLSRHVAHHRLGEDRVLQNGEYFSVTGFGELLSQRLHERYFRMRGLNASAPRSLALSGYVYGANAHDVLGCEHARKEAVGVLRSHVRDRLDEADRIGSLLSVYPGHFPLLATARGYSDTGAALVAQALKAQRGSCACLIRKTVPILSGDPSAGGRDLTVIERLTFDQAQPMVEPGGAAAGVIHPEGLGMLAEEGIPVIVGAPNDEDSARLTLITS